MTYEPEIWLQEMDARLGRMRGQAESAQADMKANNVTLTSGDRAVTMTVNGSGALLDLAFGERARSRSPQHLSALPLPPVLNDGEDPDA